MPSAGTRFLLFMILWLFFPYNAFAAVNVDGRLDENEWNDAQVFPDFVVINPLTLAEPGLKTEARILSTPEGLAVAFLCGASTFPQGEVERGRVKQLCGQAVSGSPL